MKLLMYVLSHVEKLQTLLKEFNTAGISGATIIDSSGMGRELSERDEFSIFGSMRALIDQNNKTTKTLFMVVEDDEVKKVEKVIEKVIGDLSKPDQGILFTVPLDYVKGYKKKK
ncbi:MAG: P-II family nitrogen regulator [Bacilli bacterium]